MPHCITSEHSLDGWRQGASHLLLRGEEFNLITTINDPTAVDTSWFDDFSPEHICPGIPSLSDVVTTIFPYKYANRGFTRDQLYNRYRAVNARARRIHTRSKGKWGTYFQRMIDFGAHGNNQLEAVIYALLNWRNNPRAALYMHISSPDTDRPRPLGGPCLQYVELLCQDKNTVSLLAVYRNHDYFQKALGNFIGLGQLLSFICDQTGRHAGTLTCHSAHAYYQSNKSELRNLAKLK